LVGNRPEQPNAGIASTGTGQRMMKNQRGGHPDEFDPQGITGSSSPMHPVVPGQGYDQLMLRRWNNQNRRRHGDRLRWSITGNPMARKRCRGPRQADPGEVAAVSGAPALSPDGAQGVWSPAENRLIPIEEFNNAQHARFEEAVRSIPRQPPPLPRPDRHVLEKMLPPPMPSGKRPQLPSQPLNRRLPERSTSAPRLAKRCACSMKNKRSVTNR
jgi:hypothetical protein